MSFETEQEIQKNLVCKECGAHIKYKPGSDNLKCEYCGTENLISGSDQIVEIKEIDFYSSLGEASEKTEINTVKCERCGANTTLRPELVSDNCPFCAAPLIVKDAVKNKIFKPKYLLPFKIDKKEALNCFSKWIGKLWFAPNGLKKYAQTDSKIDGVYIPYWTYDCKTTTDYTGQRGIHRQERYTYTTTENGKTVTKTGTRTVTDWYPASGTVFNNFDDILVPATKSLSEEKLNILEPWDLPLLKEYQEDYLSGFRTEVYQVELKDGYEKAKARMVPIIQSTVCGDIGGDDQRISSMETTYKETTFKHILLPVWVSAYSYKNKIYQFLVNARTGEVNGERPYSFWKILFTILLGLALIAGFFYLRSNS